MIENQARNLNINATFEGRTIQTTLLVNITIIRCFYNYNKIINIQYSKINAEIVILQQPQISPERSRISIKRSIINLPISLHFFSLQCETINPAAHLSFRHRINDSTKDKTFERPY